MPRRLSGYDAAGPQGDVVVADWGGDPSGLDAAEVLTAAGARVTLVVGSYGVGEGLHQYRRALYLERLYRAGVEILHHLQLCDADPAGVRFRNTYAADREIRIPADHLVIAQGRVPVSTPDVGALGVPVRRIGDCDTPRSLEEAVLDGTMAVQRLAGNGNSWRAPRQATSGGRTPSSTASTSSRSRAGASGPGPSTG